MKSAMKSAMKKPPEIAPLEPRRNRLALSRGYLCGAMDRVMDGGVGWRQSLGSALKDLKILWLNPCAKPIDIGTEDVAGRAHRQKAKQNGNFALVRDQMLQIRPVDLRMVALSDFIVVNLDLDIHACGSYEELYLANWLKKPVLVHIEQGAEHTPDWLLAAIPFELIFSTWAEVKAYLRHIAHDPVIDPLRRWYFFDFTGEHAL
jgi:hypothetical protein